MRESIFDFIGATNITNTVSIAILGIEYGIEDKIKYQIVEENLGTVYKASRVYKRKIYYNEKCEPFFQSQFGRMYLKDIPRFN